MDYLKILKDSYSEYLNCDETGHQTSKLEYVGEYVFGYSTYESSVLSVMARYSIDVCLAVSSRNTFGYIANGSNNVRYLLAMNMPFFINKVEWGTSIRGAWWHENLEINTGELSIKCENASQWNEFILALCKFVDDEQV